MRLTRACRPAFVWAGLLLGGAGLASSPQQTQPHAEGGHDATVHHSFDDAQAWARTFDDPARDAWQKPQELVQAMDLKPGMVVADLGAGTGYFSRFLSRAVTPGGMVLSIDVTPGMVSYLGERARREKTDNV